MTIFTRRALLMALPFARAVAGDFWNEKRYSQWDEAEVQRILTASPWAKTVTLKDGATVVVRWASAAPIQMAIARRDQGSLSVPSSPRRWNGYVITVSGAGIQGLPEKRQDLREMLLMAATLKASGKTSSQPEAVDGGDHEVEFRFPNDDAITASNSAVDFTMRLGRAVVKQRFLPAMMMFEGKLAV